jgi:hypothetical protein
MVRRDTDGKTSGGKTEAAAPGELGELPELAALEALALSVADRDTTGSRQRVIITCKRRLGADGKAVGQTPMTADDCRPLTLAAAPPIADSLKVARKSVETTPGLTDDQRRAALAGIDKAMADAEKRPAAR